MQMQGMGMQDRPSFKDKVGNAFYNIRNKVSNIRLFNRGKQAQDMQNYYDEQPYNQAYNPQQAAYMGYQNPYNNQQDYYNAPMYQDPYQAMQQAPYGQQAYGQNMPGNQYANQYQNPYQANNNFAYQEESKRRTIRRPQSRMDMEQNFTMQELKGGIKAMAQMREQEQQLEDQFEQFQQQDQAAYMGYPNQAPNHMNNMNNINHMPNMNMAYNKPQEEFYPQHDSFAQQMQTPQEDNPLSKVHIKLAVITNPQDCMRMLQLIVQPCVCIVSMENITDSAIRRICESMIVGARCVLNYKSVQLTSTNIFVMVPEEVSLDMNEHAKNLLNRFSNMRQSKAEEDFKPYAQNYNNQEMEFDSVAYR